MVAVEDVEEVEVVPTPAIVLALVSLINHRLFRIMEQYSRIT